MTEPKYNATVDLSNNTSDRSSFGQSSSSAPFFDVIALFQDASYRKAQRGNGDEAELPKKSDRFEVLKKSDNFETPKKSDGESPKKSDIAEAPNKSDEVGRPSKTAEFGTPKITESNKWAVTGQPQPGVDRLTITSEYRVSEADFQKVNPDTKVDALDTTGSFKVKHPTTGAVDDGWKFKSREKDGSINLSRDYNFDVQAKKGHDGVLEAMPGVPESFTKHLEKTINKIPPNVIANLKNCGYKIIAAATIPDAMPELEKLTPRGWPEQMKFINSDGTHDNVSKRIIAPMRFLNNGEMEPVMRDNVVTHQVGHAIDFGNQFLSATPEFVEAYNKDMRAISNKDSSIVKYLSQPDGIGRQETFAAVFGLVTTGPENESDRRFLTQSFPNVIKVVEKQIKDLK